MRRLKSGRQLRIDRQVGTLRHVLAQQAVGMLVLSTLPGAVRAGKIDLNAGTFGQNFVAVHLAAPAVRHCLAHGVMQYSPRKI